MGENRKPRKDFNPDDYSDITSDLTKNQPIAPTPREMYKITCADCNKEAEVPFKPDGVRPVFCKECYHKRHAIRSTRF